VVLTTTIDSKINTKSTKTSDTTIPLNYT